ncbi:hypothetical protein ACFQ2B_33210 [Streptomyces stramineus]
MTGPTARRTKDSRARDRPDGGCPYLAGAADTVHQLDADFVQNPYPHLERLREAARCTGCSCPTAPNAG